MRRYGEGMRLPVSSMCARFVRASDVGGGGGHLGAGLVAGPSQPCPAYSTGMARTYILISMPRSRVRSRDSGSSHTDGRRTSVAVDYLEMGAVSVEFGGDGCSGPFAVRPGPLVGGDGEHVGPLALVEVLLVPLSVGGGWKAGVDRPPGSALLLPVGREVLDGHGRVVRGGVDLGGLPGPGHGHIGQFPSAAVGQHMPGVDCGALRTVNGRGIAEVESVQLVALDPRQAAGRRRLAGRSSATPR